MVTGVDVPNARILGRIDGVKYVQLYTMLAESLNVCLRQIKAVKAVDQYAHLYAPLAAGGQSIGQRVADYIILKNIRFQIDVIHGLIDILEHRLERTRTVSQQARIIAGI